MNFDCRVPFSLWESTQLDLTWLSSIQCHSTQSACIFFPRYASHTLKLMGQSTQPEKCAAAPLFRLYAYEKICPNKKRSGQPQFQVKSAFKFKIKCQCSFNGFAFIWKVTLVAHYIIVYEQLLWWLAWLGRLPANSYIHFETAAKHVTGEPARWLSQCRFTAAIKIWPHPKLTAYCSLIGWWCADRVASNWSKSHKNMQLHEY